MALIIDKNLCPQNHKCPAIAQCPVDALSQKSNGLPEVDADECIECGKCAEFCPMGALQIRD